MQTFNLKYKKERTKAKTSKVVIWSSLLLLSVFLIAFSSADLQVGLDGSTEHIDPITQGQPALLYQTCNNCTYCNLTSVRDQDGSLLLENTAFDADGTYYSKLLTGGNTTTLGTYTYCYDCGNSADSETGCIEFKVTPSGRDGNENIALVIILIVIIYAVTLISFFGKNVPLSILTGMMMTFFGVWIIRNGIVVYRDNLTNYFGYATIFIGALISLWAAIEWIEEIF